MPMGVSTCFGGGGRWQLQGVHDWSLLFAKAHQGLLAFQLLLVPVELVVVDEGHVGIADHVVNGL